VIVFLACVLGLLCGSFTNVLISRIPKGQEWVRTPSHCPRCSAPLAWYDNIPVVSWLWLRRRCRHCKAPISAQYPLVELTVAVLFGLVAWQFGLTFLAAALVYLAIVSVALAVIDLEHMRLPDALTLRSYPVLLVLVAAHSLVTDDWWLLLRALIGAVALGAFYFVFWFVYPKGMGFGDVKCAVLLGFAMAAVGWGALAVGAFAGPLIGGIAGVAVMIRTGKSRGVKIPYGPWLIAGAWIGIVVGPAIADRYLALVTGA